MSGISYTPVLSFASPENLRTVHLGGKASAVVTVEQNTSVLPGKNTFVFCNPDGRELECAVTARDLNTGKERLFKVKGTSPKISVPCELKESE